MAVLQRSCCAPAGRPASHTCCHGRQNQQTFPTRFKATQGRHGPGQRAMVKPASIADVLVESVGSESAMLRLPLHAL